MTINDHADAVLALLAAAPPASPPLVVYSGQVPTGTSPPYVRVYVHGEDPTDSGSRPLTGSSKRFVCWVICHCVGANDTAARAVAQRVRAALLDVVPTVTGRTCFPIRHDSAPPPVPDETTGVLVIDQISTYRLESIPA